MMLALPAATIVNNYIDSVDLEWEFADNVTTYSIHGVTLKNLSDFISLNVRNNKVTLYGSKYILTVKCVPDSPCHPAGTRLPCQDGKAIPLLPSNYALSFIFRE